MLDCYITAYQPLTDDLNLIIHVLNHKFARNMSIY